MGEIDTFDPTVYDVDATPSDLVFDVEEDPSSKERVAVIRTSDRITFRRCRRRWAWSSHLRGNLGAKEGQSPLWMGTGFHFALEDFHGHNKFGKPSAAFEAFAAATLKHDRAAMPPNWREDMGLAVGMLNYYSEVWLSNRSPLKTFVFNGEPQVEVNFRVEIPYDATKFGYTRVIYSGTLDRVVEDDYGQLWIVEYKTAKTVQTLHLANDSQVSSYCWASNLLYGRPIAGVIYQQHRKEIPHPPRILANGRLSTDKSQLITRASLREAALNIYGRADLIPLEYIDMMNYLEKGETVDVDKFVDRRRITRNEYQTTAEGEKILMEVEEMLNPNLALYPNPDRTCQFMCTFNGPCVSLDDGGDYEYELSILTKQREPKYDTWRNDIVYPTGAM